MKKSHFASLVAMSALLIGGALTFSLLNRSNEVEATTEETLTATVTDFYDTSGMLGDHFTYTAEVGSGRFTPYIDHNRLVIGVHEDESAPGNYIYISALDPTAYHITSITISTAEVIVYGYSFSTDPEALMTLDAYPVKGIGLTWDTPHTIEGLDTPNIALSLFNASPDSRFTYISITYKSVQTSSYDYVAINGTMSKTAYKAYEGWDVAGLSIEIFKEDGTNFSITHPKALKHY